MADLDAPPAAGDLVLERLADTHRERLRAACAEDLEVWPIYSVSFDPIHFDHSFQALIDSPTRIAFAVIAAGELAGMSAYINPDRDRGVVEIGNTFLRPELRGGDLNRRLKQLMLRHAFACGFRRIEFRVDLRNERSQAALAKLGAVKEGVLRQERATWTGHVRDTALFSILGDEWPTAG